MGEPSSSAKNWVVELNSRVKYCLDHLAPVLMPHSPVKLSSRHFEYAILKYVIFPTFLIPNLICTRVGERGLITCNFKKMKM